MCGHSLRIVFEANCDYWITLFNNHSAKQLNSQHGFYPTVEISMYQYLSAFLMSIG
ncbi:hypothetical protein M5D96_000509 [Drosophila gunungcola]|uniref:Uncharacterized protein n=1 Tax=Drosophila gunungcola TaxID=103775 RepID=A0A9P9YWX6_9MUSC|nr:hypothetical protein M5D96_000509 [Drosophila gunungcola]